MRTRSTIFCIMMVLAFWTYGYNYSFVQITDTHVNNDITRAKFRSIIKDLHDLKEKPDFIINTGDITEFGSADELRAYSSIADSAGIKIYNLPGNHDTRWSNVGKKRFKAILGPLYQSFDHKGIHFILLDSGLLFQQYGHFSQEQLLWLENDLKATGTEKPVIMAVHHPIFLEKTYIDNETALFDLIKNHNVILILTGHGHRHDHWNVNNIDLVMAQAVKAKKPGYRLFQISSDSTISAFTKDLHNAKPEFEFRNNIFRSQAALEFTISSPRCERTYNENLPILVDLKGAENGEFSFDKANWQPLQKNGSNYYENLDISMLSEGFHDLYIRGTYEQNTWLDICKFKVERGNIEVIFKAFTAGGIQSSPVFIDSAIIFGSTDARLYKLNKYDGKKDWFFTSGGPVVTTPVVVRDTLFFTSGDGKCYALNAESGESIWDSRAGEAIFSSPVYFQHKVLFGSSDSCLYALNSKDGKILWKYKTGGFIKARPAVGDSMVTFGSWDGNFYCLSLNNGELIWKQRISDNIYHSAATSNPLIVENNVFVSSHDHTVHAFDLQSGDILWKHYEQDDHRPGYSSPAIIRDKVIFGSLSGHLFALNKESGEEIWTTTLSESIDPVFDSSPHINYPNVLVGSVGGDIYCVSLYNGKKQWTHKLNNGYIFSTPVVHDKIIYVGTNEGYFYALKVL